MFDAVDGFYGFGRADLLASFALFDNDPNKINELEKNFKQVTPEVITKTVKEYLRPTNRTILTVTPGEAPEDKSDKTAEQGE